MSANNNKKNSEKAYDSIVWETVVSESESNTVISRSVSIDGEVIKLSENALFKLYLAEIEHYVDGKEDERRRIMQIIEEVCNGSGAWSPELSIIVKQILIDKDYN